MKRTLLILTFALSSAALAQMHGHGGGHGSSPGSSNARHDHEETRMEPRFFDGEVRGIDRESATVVLQHDAISVLDMPAAVMAHPVKDASMLDLLKTGDKVRFTLVQQGRAVVITKIVPAD